MTTTTLFKLTLGVHVVNGTVALLVAPLAMVTVKGGLWHRRWGKIYFWAMAVVAATAAVMCWLRTGLFLFLIAVFSFYLALTGYRALKQKGGRTKPGLVDVGATGAMLLTGVGLAVLAARVSEADWRWILAVFAGLALMVGALDVARWVRPGDPADKQAWLRLHLTRFLGAYVATVTAFSVVNFQFLPTVWRWLWPTAVGTVGIAVWRSRYQRKDARNVKSKISDAPQILG